MSIPLSVPCGYCTDLYYSVQMGHQKCFDHYIVKTRNINQSVDEFKSAIGSTALMNACEKNNFYFVRTLVENGANVNYQRESGATVLMVAAFYSSGDIINYLVQNGAQINIITNYSTSLHNAIRGRKVENLKLLLSLGADPNIKDQYGSNCLYVLKNVKLIEMIEILLNYGADPHLKNNKGISAYEHCKDIAIKDIYDNMTETKEPDVDLYQ